MALYLPRVRPSDLFGVKPIESDDVHVKTINHPNVLRVVVPVVHRLMVGREYAVIAGEVDARVADQGRQPSDEVFRASCPPPVGPACGGSKSLPAILSRGSNTTCVVPCRYGVFNR